MMQGLIVVLAFGFLKVGYAWPTRNPQHVLNAPLSAVTASRKLHGRFLHITDLHPDPSYKVHSSTNDGIACHRESGPAGTYGAETSDCDSPFALINETFKWIENNLKDTVDFVVWTGDSARHDNDEEIPRSEEEVLYLNNYIAGKFVDVFGNGNDDADPAHELSIPVIPTFGNNDILPHNILLPGPNQWLQRYADVWQKFIPEEQRHGFQRGGWFWVEAIPNKLAVFSLNTLYFFDRNSAVDGCALRSEPGWEQMEWLRIQLQFMRQRGIKAILIGHVPPARTEGKQLWDETCWQKYTLWLQQYRDVVVSGIYGHMNIDHFLLQDTKDIDLAMFKDLEIGRFSRDPLDDELSIESAADYLDELRARWSKLPNPSLVTAGAEDYFEAGKGKNGNKGKKGNKSKKDKILKEMGGPWGERFQLSTIGPSVVPNYFPTLRVFEYNITGLEDNSVWKSENPSGAHIQAIDWLEQNLPGSGEDAFDFLDISNDDRGAPANNNKKKHKKPKKPKDPNLNIPAPPSKSSPPGPAYSPQTLTLLGYVQYFANLTRINNDTLQSPDPDVDTQSWHGGKHKDKRPKNDKPHPKEFSYEVEYSTSEENVFRLRDLTVKSYLKLAHRIGQYKPPKHYDNEDAEGNKEIVIDTTADLFFELPDKVQNIICYMKQGIAHLRAWLFLSTEEYERLIYQGNIEPWKSKKHRGHKKKGEKRKKKNKAWLVFIKRAFVGTLDDEEIEELQRARDEAAIRSCVEEGVV